MAGMNKKSIYRFGVALAVLLFIFGLSYFAGNDESFLNFKPSVEVGIFSLSPRGPSGGLIIPASCPSYEHYPGECTAPPSPFADIRANATGDPNWVNGSDGPLSIVNNTAVTVTWISSDAGSCTVTKNGGACSLGSDSCTALNLDPGTLNNSGSLTGGPFRYSINCSGASDAVNISIQTINACTDGLDNDGDGLRDWDDGIANGVMPPAGFSADPGCTSSSDTDEVNRYVCSQGVCSSAEGVGINNGGCSYNRLSARCALTQCNDGIDNDGDGKTDFPADLGCTSVNDNNEGNIPGIFKECNPELRTC